MTTVAVYSRQGVSGFIICHLVSIASRGLGLEGHFYSFARSFGFECTHWGHSFKGCGCVETAFSRGEKRTTGRVAKKKKAMNGPV
jgi:hypothetical protein